MPRHVVQQLFRSSTSSLETNTSVPFKYSSTRRRHSPGNTCSPDRVCNYTGLGDSLPPGYCTAMSKTSRASSFSSNEGASREHHRLSFPGLHLGRKDKEKDRAGALHSPAAQSAHAALSWRIESPPAVFYGDAEHSSGALVSGLLFLDVTRDEGLDFESFIGTMTVNVKQKKPFASQCNDCTHQSTELKKWTFLERPAPMAKGRHGFPFSILLEGHLPASVDTSLMSISYHFKAEAASKLKSGTVRIERILDVKRSLPLPDVPHHSVRVFPPTNIKASVTFPQIIHPIGSNTLQLRIDGISRVNSGNNTIEYWRLKKLTWRLEETVKTVAPACTKHAPNTAAAEDVRKGVQRTDTRIIGSAVLLSGWKSDYSSTSDSAIEMDIEYQASQPPAGSGHSSIRPSCDVHARDGTEVTHQLMLEMVVSEEWAPNNKPSHVTQTGTGRILRMHFACVMTERAGIGISWDNESPPIYQDVPPSPPAYSQETRLAPDGSNAASPPPIDEHIEMLDVTREASPSPLPPLGGSPSILAADNRPDSVGSPGA